MNRTATHLRTRLPYPLWLLARLPDEDRRLAASAAGVIGGAVVRAARRSAHMARRQFAHAIEVDCQTLLDIEDGEIPLFCVPYGILREIADALTGPDLVPADRVRELVTAADCDLLLTAMLCGFEDYAEVPPIDRDTPDGVSARELLRWALAGVVPGRYQPVAEPGCLLGIRERSQITAMARELSAGASGSDLTGFGFALVMLAITATSSGSQPC